jgi:hypothetical protein
MAILYPQPWLAAMVCFVIDEIWQTSPHYAMGEFYAKVPFV